MKFTKMQGCGNDYVYINGSLEEIPKRNECAIRLSDRHFGIGSDGVIFINPSEKADFEMEMYNADGSRGEMCGNGIRCVAKYVHDKGLTDKTELQIETLAGIKSVSLALDENGRTKEVTVDMGSPEMDPAKIPCTLNSGEPSSPIINVPIIVQSNEYRVTAVSMGNPHAVIFMDSINDLDLERMGPMFETHPAFPNRVNTEFVRVIDRSTLQMRVWERGSGETLACGTGACASLVAAVLNGYAEDEAVIKLKGGELSIKWDRQENRVYMTGPAQFCFEGSI